MEKRFFKGFYFSSIRNQKHKKTEKFDRERERGIQRKGKQGWGMGKGTREEGGDDFFYKHFNTFLKHFNSFY